MSRPVLSSAAVCRSCGKPARFRVRFNTLPVNDVLLCKRHLDKNLEAVANPGPYFPAGSFEATVKQV